MNSTQVNKDSQKGRPKKKGFKGTLVNPQSTYADVAKTGSIGSGNTSLMITNSKYPIGLLNNSENICFLNSIVQTLYHIPEVRNYVESAVCSSVPLLTIQNLFHAIYSAVTPVHSFDYALGLDIPNYRYGEQHDCHEALIYILEQIYPSPRPESISDDCISKIQTHASWICQSCEHSADKIEEHSHINLKFSSTTDMHTVKTLINFYMRKEHSHDYTCDNCHRLGSCTEQTTITSCSDLIIITLGVFEYDRRLNMSHKIFPDVTIDESILHDGDTFKLHAVIYHHGMTPNSGHYTSSVRVNDTWFTFDDAVVSSDVSLYFRNANYKTPYLVVYKRQNQPNANVSNSSAQVSVSTDPSSSQSATKSIVNESFVSPATYSNTVNSRAKKIQDKIEKSFDSLHKVIETDCQSQSLDKLSVTKQAVVKELFKQTDRIAKASTDSLFVKDHKVIKRKSKFSSPSKLNESDRKRKKIVRDNLPEKIKEKEKQSLQSRMKR